MFSPTFESLYNYTCPDWFRDAKFGIWSHWGPQSVPMCGDWYARHMYMQGTPQYLYHLRHYGHPSQFGYKDICRLWKAENFDPEGLMDLYVRAGARYFVAQAMHHDNFFNYDSDVNRFNAVKIGPEKDICGLWKAAAKRHGLPFGMTEHLGASFSWWKVNKGADSEGPFKGVPYDGNDPEYRDFYHANEEYATDTIGELGPWYTENEDFHRYWAATMKEIVDKYQPELIYSDGALPFGSHQHTWERPWRDETEPGDASYSTGLEFLSYYYNQMISPDGVNQAVYLQKDTRPEIFNVGILDIEKSQLPGLAEKPWHTDTCIGNWFYDAKQTYKRCDQIVEMLVDIVSKNGTMLLNILQKPDGSIDEESRYLLEALAGWFDICSEGIHGTRPWKTFGEGETRVKIDGFTEDKTQWGSTDFRFTCKGQDVYAFVMGKPEGGVCQLRSFAGEKIRSVSLLGGDALPFTTEEGLLRVELPLNLPTAYTNCLKVTLG